MKIIRTIREEEQFKHPAKGAFFFTFPQKPTYHMRRKGLWREGCKEKMETILQEYALALEWGEAKKGQDYWRLKGEQQSYGLWEYQGEPERLERALEWQEYLKEKGCRGVLGLIKTKGERNYVRREKSYYLTEWEDGTPVVIKKEGILAAMAELLATIHYDSRDFKSRLDDEQSVEYGFPWLRAKQERLTELLMAFQYLKEKRTMNDYERLYLENFSDVYQQGQEAIQKMALAGTNTPRDLPNRYLVGNLRAENFGGTEQGLVVLRTTDWQRGPAILDLSLLLKMYLPLEEWNWEVAKEAIVRYQKKSPLSLGEKYLLVALLSFPGRFWGYAQQYFSEPDNSLLLVEKLKNYLYELPWQERCLAKLEGWLWEEKGSEGE